MTALASLDGDAELMIRVREGDDASFALLLEKYRGPVVHFLYRMVHRPDVAEELAQEVFLRVYKSRATYEPTAKFTTWLFRIATHVALNWLREAGNRRTQQSIEEDTEGPRRELADDAPTVEHNLVNRARLNEIRQAIEALPPKQRAAVLMHKYEEMEYAQIARALGCSESALKSLLFRAYETLRAKLAHLSEGRT